MNNIENICEKLINSIEGIISASLINLQDGTILASSFKESTNKEEINRNISSAAMDILKSNSAEKIQKYINEQKGQNLKDSFKEVFISSTNNFYFIRVVDDLELAIFVISNKLANQGLIWSEIKMSITKIKQII